MTKPKKTPASKKIPCPYGCGMKTAPGPMAQHRKACELRPNKKPFTIVQPERECRWGCGLITTYGALSTHEAYGCELRPIDNRTGKHKDLGDARVPCKYGCPDVKTMPGAMARHYKVCPRNPANPQLIGKVTASGQFKAS